MSRIREICRRNEHGETVTTVTAYAPGDGSLSFVVKDFQTNSATTFDATREECAALLPEGWELIEDGPYFRGRKIAGPKPADDWPTCKVCGSNLGDDDELDQPDEETGTCTVCKAQHTAPTIKVWALATDSDDNGTEASIYTDERQMYLDLAEKMGDDDENAQAAKLAEAGDVEALAEYVTSIEAPYLFTYSIDEREIAAPVDPDKPMALNERETATVLHALRAMQDHLQYGNGIQRCDEQKGCRHFDGVEPLTVDEIDDLCERLNFFDVAAKAPRR